MSERRSSSRNCSQNSRIRCRSSALLGLVQKPSLSTMSLSSFLTTCFALSEDHDEEEEATLWVSGVRDTPPNDRCFFLLDFGTLVRRVRVLLLVMR